MDDPELAAAIVAGDSDGLSEALDRYAASLFAYSRAVLPAADFGEEAAAEVVRDTFVIARAKLDDLADPGQLGPWLDAMARSECQRRLIAAGRTAAPRPAAPATGHPGAAPDGEPPAFPQRLHGQVLMVCTDETPAGRAFRASVTHRAGRFGHDGFPKAVAFPGRLRPHATGVIAAVAAMVSVAVIVAVVVAVLGGSRPGLAAAAGPAGRAGGPAVAAAGISSSGAGAGPSHGATRVAGQPSPQQSGPGQQSGGTPRPGATVSLQAAHSAGPPATPSPGTPSASATPSPSPSPSPAGVLIVSASRISLVSVGNQPSSRSFLLTAQGGPISDYSISIVSGPAAHVLIMPSAGSIPAGGSVTIKVTAWGKTSFSARMVISPGGQPVVLRLVAKV